MARQIFFWPAPKKVCPSLPQKITQSQGLWSCYIFFNLAWNWP